MILLSPTGNLTTRFRMPTRNRHFMVRLFGERKPADFGVLNHRSNAKLAQARRHEAFGSQLPCQHIESSLPRRRAWSGQNQAFCLSATRRPTIPMPRYDARASLDHHGKWRGTRGTEARKTDQHCWPYGIVAAALYQAMWKSTGCSSQYVTPWPSHWVYAARYVKCNNRYLHVHTKKPCNQATY
jgi:hypothetical protein